MALGSRKKSHLKDTIATLKGIVVDEQRSLLKVCVCVCLSVKVCGAHCDCS